MNVNIYVIKNMNNINEHVHEKKHVRRT
jgi:hypothetical protein